MIISIVAIIFGIYLILFYYGKVTAGRGEQHAIMLRKLIGPFILAGGIGAVCIGVFHILALLVK